MGAVVAAILIVFGVFFLIALAFRADQSFDKDRYEEGVMEEEEKKEYEEKLRKTTIKKVKIVANSSSSRKSATSSIARGAIGGALLGPAGLVGGAVSGKTKTTNTTTFLIEYADGHRETKSVVNDSAEFNKLCKYLDM